LFVFDKGTLDTITQATAAEAKTRFGDRLDRVLLYGSYARGDYDEESDVDIMILANIEPEEADRLDSSLIRLASRLGLEHDMMVSLTVRDTKTFFKWVDVVPFYQNVIKDGVLIHA
jgi:predicted nucleotidyltransferase